MSDFGNLCKSNNCQHFIAWVYQFDDEYQPYPCESCMLVGPSYIVDTIAKGCPFVEAMGGANALFNDLPYIIYTT